MLLKDFKQKFIAELKGDYPKEEVNSFFNILTEAFLGLSRLDLALQPARDLSEAELKKFEDSLSRLQQHEPVQYITGKKEFFGLQFRVNPHVLIPRPETEELVQRILDDLHEKKDQELRILDVGTGSGCIAISLAKNLPQAKVTAMDISEGALQTAQENAELNSVKVKFLKKDVLQLKELEDQYDIIVSNPPYVRELEKKEMQRNVLEFEPKTALYVDDDSPLIFYQKISELAARNLLPGGAVYFEINQYLATETERILAEKDFRTRLKKDIFGVYRMLKGEK
ncbi:peptide chain release factor N(5)-glutamine methyltransferase [Salinimicrobium soli]|uniref:peptide chain release factor N(5)-glutamine methyltransferase n=1 Tax=Salinimicrobium soli TaxID=1254399 RepID=UPI003AABA5DE